MASAQVGVPTNGSPLVVDMATSSTAYFALVEAQRAGRSVGDDIGFVAAGDVTTDPGAILAGGAMRSFDRCHNSFLMMSHTQRQRYSDLHTQSCFLCCRVLPRAPQELQGQSLGAAD